MSNKCRSPKGISSAGKYWTGPYARRPAARKSTIPIANESASEIQLQIKKGK